MKKKNIFVFLSNKINTFDIFFPLAKKLKSKNKNLFFKFFVFNKKTYEDIYDNTLFSSEVNNLGSIQVINGQFLSQYKIFRIFFTVFNIFNIIIYSLLFRTSFFHFKGLERFPYCLLYFANKKNCYLIDSNPWGFSENINDAYNIKNNKKIGSQDKLLLKKYSKLISFSQKWNQVGYSYVNNKDVYFFNSTRAQKNWLEFCKIQSHQFLNQQPKLKNRIKGKRVVLYLFGTFSNIVTVDETYDGRKLFEKTMKVLNNLKNFFIIIKPHPNADLELLKKLIDEYKNKNIIIINMHISVLSNFCHFAISNYMSLAMGDAWLNGTTTIEFTKYKQKLLKKTNFRSVIPEFADYFIDITLSKKLEKILYSNHKLELRNYKNDIPNDDEKIFLKKFNKSMNL